MLSSKIAARFIKQIFWISLSKRTVLILEGSGKGALSSTMSSSFSAAAFHVCGIRRGYGDRE
jgi:hypothetical protein